MKPLRYVVLVALTAVRAYFLSKIQNLVRYHTSAFSF